MNGYDLGFMDAFFYLCCLLVSSPRFITSHGHTVRRSALGYFGAHSEEGHCVTTLPPLAFDIPKSLSSAIIPDF